MTVLVQELRMPLADVPSAQPREESAVGIPELPPAIPFGGLRLAPLHQHELIEWICARAACRVRTTVHYLNAHVFRLARHDAGFSRLLSECDLLYADGISIVLAARALGYAIPDRLTAADYFVEFCRACADQGLRPFLLGGAAGVAEIAAERLARAVPGFQCAGTSHGFLTGSESMELGRRIDRSKADVLIVGMNSPVQEQWIRHYAQLTNVPVQWSVGALLDFVAGTERRAPGWVRRWHGEWLFRFLVNPSQRWRRYLLGNASFAAWLARELLLRRPMRPA